MKARISRPKRYPKQFNVKISEAHHRKAQIINNSRDDLPDKARRAIHKVIDKEFHCLTQIPGIASKNSA